MYYVVDETQGYAIVFRTPSLTEAEKWIAKRSKIEPDKVLAGMYGIDGPVVLRD